MRWINNSGKLIWHSDAKYRINWNKKAPSNGAQAVKDFLRKYCFDALWYEEYRLPTTKLRVDFLSPTKKLAIEFNGPQHETFNKFFHQTRSGFISSIKRDFKKEAFLTRNGYKLIEIYGQDLPLTREFFIEKYGIYL